MQREYAISPRQVREYTMRELGDLREDYDALRKERQASTEG